MIRAGFHLSVAGGMYNSADEAKRMNYRAFQIFASSPRTWKATEIKDDDADKFRELSKGSSSFAHIPYLCNPSSAVEELWAKSRSMLVSNLLNCSKLGVGNVVIHLGSHMGKGVEYAKGRVADFMASVLDVAPEVGILLENSAGQKNCVGGKLPEIKEIIEKVGARRMGLCFDTCHAFASGYDLTTDQGVSVVAKEIGAIGKERLGLVHLNDAKFPLGSGLDRHWHIGKGNIGANGFKRLFSNKLFQSGNFVMETPEDEVSNDVKNMEELQKILASCRLKANV